MKKSLILIMLAASFSFVYAATIDCDNPLTDGCSLQAQANASTAVLCNDGTTIDETGISQTNSLGTDVDVCAGNAGISAFINGAGMLVTSNIHNVAASAAAGSASSGSGAAASGAGAADTVILTTILDPLSGLDPAFDPDNPIVWFTADDADGSAVDSSGVTSGGVTSGGVTSGGSTSSG
jgi:hypothetical protein